MHIWKNTNDKDAQEMHCQSNSLSVSLVNYNNTVPFPKIKNMGIPVIVSKNGIRKYLQIYFRSEKLNFVDRIFPLISV